MEDGGQHDRSERDDGQRDAGGTAHRPQVLLPLLAVFAHLADHEYSMPSGDGASVRGSNVKLAAGRRGRYPPPHGAVVSGRMAGSDTLAS